MFKNVEYAGFDNHPELRRLAELGTTLLPEEIRSMREDVSVVWEAPAGPGTDIELTLTLDLPIGTGRGTRYIPATEFPDTGLLRSRIRRVWDDALGNLLDKRRPVWDELLREPVEV